MYNLTNDFLSSYFSNPTAIVALIAALLLYKFLSRRYRRLPPLPIGWVVAYLSLHLIETLLPEPFAAENPELAKWITVGAIIFLNFAIVRLLFAVCVDFWYHWRRKGIFPTITRDVILAGCYLVIVFVVLRTRGGVNLISLVTTSAVLTAVIGFAAQNTLGNLFAGLSLQMEKPYNVGDWISYGENTGQVVGIGWNATKLRTFDDEIIIVPNLDITKAVLKNFSRPSKRHVMKIEIGLDYNTPPNYARGVLLQALHDDQRVVQDPPPQVRVLQYADFAITYQLRFAYNDYGTWPMLRGEIMNNLWYALKRARISIPFPVRDVRLHHVERRVDLARRERENEAIRANIDATPMLTPLSASERELIARKMRVQDYGQREVVVKQGEAGDSMYILHRGACDVVVKSGDSPEMVVATLTPPAFFGEMSLLTGEPRTATVRAKEDSRLFAIHKELFAEILQKDPKISEQLAKALARRQDETAAKLGKQREDEAAAASKLLARIRTFFGVS